MFFYFFLFIFVIVLCLYHFMANKDYYSDRHATDFTVLKLHRTQADQPTPGLDIQGVRASPQCVTWPRWDGWMRWRERLIVTDEALLSGVVGRDSRLPRSRLDVGGRQRLITLRPNATTPPQTSSLFPRHRRRRRRRRRHHHHGILPFYLIVLYSRGKYVKLIYLTKFI